MRANWSIDWGATVNNAFDLQGPKISDLEHLQMGTYIEREFGIKMPFSKKTMLETRLHKRIAVCGFNTYGEYFKYVTSDPRGREEFLHFADLVSTHETSFFREPSHFSFLLGHVLPFLIREQRMKHVSVLSAACSSGEEAYTSSMIIQNYMDSEGFGSSFSIEGIDLSEKSVELARRGVFSGERIQKIPNEYLVKYVMRSKDPSKNLFRIVPELRQMQDFHCSNLLKDADFHKTTYEVIFCRNVLIYFDDDNKKKLLNGLIKLMHKQSFLFLGHSETIMSFNLPLKSVANAVYVKA